jgi:hypothetical protein
VQSNESAKAFSLQSHLELAQSLGPEPSDKKRAADLKFIDTTGLYEYNK